MPNRAATIARRRSEVCELTDMPLHMQERIQRLVDAPRKPPKWLAMGPADSPRPLAWIPSRAWFEWHWARGIDPEGRRESLPPTLRALVIARDGLICQLCFEPVDEGDVHIDHIKPWSKGGTHTLGNLQVTHSTCNLRKGARLIE